MKSVTLNVPMLGFIVVTRAALGVGVGLLLSERLPTQRRRTLAATLIGIGAATTVPAAWSVIRSVRRQTKSRRAVKRDNHLIGVVRFPRKGDDNNDRVMEEFESFA